VGDPAWLPCGQQVTHVLHAAADPTLCPQLTPLQCYDQIGGGTRNLLTFVVACA
jgi:UDP-glucuronate decarboxylase